MKQQTFSQILEPYHDYGFDIAFWCTYSLDFSTVEFLINRDFKRIMAPCSIHLMCDPHQWSEQLSSGISDQHRLNKMARMQQYCTMSFQPAVGAFHPKILLLASEETILLLLSSANATSSGILSNQDLIAGYHYTSAQREHGSVIKEFMNYLSQLTGWNPTAREHINKLQDRYKHLFVTPSAKTVLTIPAGESLLEQMRAAVGEPQSVNHICIHSPFFDTQLEAVTSLYDVFQCPIEVLTPSQELVTTRASKIPLEIAFRSTATLPKSGFHAKFYEFRRKVDSLVFWGSANCSKSGILLPERNYEFLIGEVMTVSEIQEIWPDTSQAIDCKMTYTPASVDKDKDKDRKGLIIVSVERIEDRIQVEYSGSGSYSSCVGYLGNGEILDLEVIHKESSSLVVKVDTNQIILLYLDLEGARVSTFGFVNYPEQIAARVQGNQTGGNPFSEGLKAEKAICFAFGYFNIDSAKPGSRSTNRGKKQGGFWHEPRFSRTGYFGQVVDLENFVNSRMLYYNLKRDEDYEDEKIVEYNTTQERTETHSIIWREAEKVRKNLSVLIDKHQESEIIVNRWLIGLDIISTYILEVLRDNSGINEFERIVPFLHNISTVAVWLSMKAPREHVDYTPRMEIVSTLLNTFLCASLYDYLTVARKIRRNDLLYALDELYLVRRAVYLRYIIGCHHPDVNIKSEHSKETIIDFLEKLSWRHLAESIRKVWVRGDLRLIESLPPIYAYELDGYPHLYLEDEKGHAVLQGIVPGNGGRERKYSRAQFYRSMYSTHITLNF